MIPPLDRCLSKSFWSSHHFCWKLEPIAASSSWVTNTKLLLSWFFQWKRDRHCSFSRWKTASVELFCEVKRWCYLGQLRCRRGQKLIDIVRQRLSAHRTHHSQLLWDQSVIKPLIQKDAKRFLWAELFWPGSRSCLWSCPPPAPSPSDGARSQSGWRSGRGSGSGSSDSSWS